MINMMIVEENPMRATYADLIDVDVPAEEEDTGE